MSINLVPVVLCGGIGSRLWPISTPIKPKQFFKFDDKFSLIQKTVLTLVELNKKVKIKYIIFVTNEDYRFQLLSHLQSINLKIKFKIILEPCSKNTAPSLTLSSIETENLKNCILLCLPSDHFIKKDKIFIKNLARVIGLYNFKSICTFGIKPTEPNTEFGYIKFSGNNLQKKVVSFHEKPTLQNAEKYVKSRFFLWNSGIFITSPKLWIDSLKILNNKNFVYAQKSYYNKKIDGPFIRPSRNSFNLIKGNSIDYEIIEKFSNISLDLNVCSLNVGWSDLGSYKSIDESVFVKNGLNKKKGIAFFYDSKNNLVLNYTDKNLVLNGVSDSIVVATTHDILVSSKRAEKNIKNAQALIAKNNNESTQIPIHKPWGNYILLVNDTNFKVKKITINSKQSISLQKHNYRNEHWVIVKGLATVIKGNAKYKMKENESIYINKKQKHRLSNDTAMELVVIEVQTGTHLSEDDIVRYHDNYLRA